MRRKYYTVYGYYEDNNQVSVDYVYAADSVEALKLFEGSGETTRYGIVALRGKMARRFNERAVGGREWVANICRE